MIKRTLLLMAVAIVLWLCSDNTTNPSNVTVVVPKTGSIFVYEEFETDSTTGDPIPSTADTITYKVTQSGVSFQGRSNVAVFTDLSDSTDGPQIAYESNGDVSLFMQLSQTGPGIWLTMPISSKTESTVTVMDTSYTIGVITIRSTSKIKSEYIGTSTVMVKGQSVNVIQGRQSTISTYTVGTNASESIMTADFYVAPSLGIWAKGTNSPITIPGVGKVSGGISTLIDFELK